MSRGRRVLNLQLEKEMSSFFRVFFDYPSAKTLVNWFLFPTVKDVKDDKLEIESIKDFF